jgi:uncharacterized protein (TIGR02246 family)
MGSARATRAFVPWGCVLALAGLVAWQQLSRAVADPLDAWRILRLVRTFEGAAEAHDAEALVALFHPDAEHFGLGSGRLIRGHAALRELFVAEFAGEAGAERAQTRIASFRFLTPRVLLGDVTVRYTNYRLGDRVWPTYREHTFVVLTKRRGGWRIAATSAGGHDPEASP